jgi:nicotinamide riboside kinase
MAEALRIAVLGAECTGKSELTLVLQQRLAAATGLRVAAVGEWLREWCDAHQRTPQQHEQAAIAAEQQRRIDAACAQHELVVCDTTPLMTAVYSIWYFADDSLLDAALEALAEGWLVMLAASDLPWQADGVQRDGAHVREPIDDLLRHALSQRRIPFTVIQGLGPQRTDAAFRASAAWLKHQGVAVASPAGLFTALLASHDPGRQRRQGAWICECCVPEAEQATLARLRSTATSSTPWVQFKTDEPGA